MRMDLRKFTRETNMNIFIFSALFALVDSVYQADETTTLRVPFTKIECAAHVVHDIPLLHSFNGTIGSGRVTVFQRKCELPDGSGRACYWAPDNHRERHMGGDCVLQPLDYIHHGDLRIGISTPQTLCTDNGIVPSGQKLSHSSFTCADRSVIMFGKHCMLLAPDTVSRECVFLCRDREEFPFCETGLAWKLLQYVPEAETLVFTALILAQLCAAWTVTRSDETKIAIAEPLFVMAVVILRERVFGGTD